MLEKNAPQEDIELLEVQRQVKLLVGHGDQDFNEPLPICDECTDPDDLGDCQFDKGMLSASPMCPPVVHLVQAGCRSRGHVHYCHQQLCLVDEAHQSSPLCTHGRDCRGVLDFVCP